MDGKVGATVLGRPLPRGVAGCPRKGWTIPVLVDTLKKELTNGIKQGN